MLSKLSLSLLLTLSFSLSCLGQVVSTGGYATTMGPTITPISAANAPLVATPDVALPGSGPAVGAPLGSSNSNDSRVSTGPSVYNPNGFVPVESAEVAATNANPGSQTTVNSSSNAPANNQVFEFGVQQVITESPSPSGSASSLGEIARDLRAHPRPATKMINNDTVARLNASGATLGNPTAQDTNTVAATLPSNTPVQGAASTNTLMAQNQTPALPQSDQSEAVEPPQSASKPSPTAGQQRHAPESQASTSSAAQSSASGEQNPAPAQSAANSQNSAAKTKLPQTASHLPLILLLGGLGVGGGTLYLLRR
jgi:hypothetical protein